MNVIQVTASFTAIEFARTLEVLENAVAAKQREIKILPELAPLTTLERDTLFSAYRKLGGYQALRQLVTK